MKLTRHAVLLCGSSFLAGVILSSICWLIRTQVHSVSSSVVSSRPLAQDPSLGRAKEPDELGGLTDEKYLTRLNGTRLKLNYGSWAPAVDIPSFIQTSRIFPLATGELLVGLEDTAREAHRGLWALAEEDLMPPWQYRYLRRKGKKTTNVLFLKSAEASGFHQPIAPVAIGVVIPPGGVSGGEPGARWPIVVPQPIEVAAHLQR